MSKEINTAIAMVMGEVGMLGKGDINKHQNYAFVSVDSYYKALSPIMSKHGLSFSLNETKFIIHPMVGKAPAIEIGYSVRMMHASGETIPDFSSVTILHPIQGAQTAGSAMSYASKVFARQMFLVQTGEEDADSTPSDAFSGTVTVANGFDDLGPKVEVKTEPPAVESVEKIMMTFLPTATSEKELTKFWSDNIAALTVVKDNDKAMHGRIIEAFKRRKAELKGA